VSTFRAPRTRAVRAGIDRDVDRGAVVSPIHLSSNFSFAGFAVPRPFDYTRSGNPTRSLLAAAIADLEGGGVAVADHTFLSPARQRPLSLGADVVVHSTTKYLNGHCDAVGGAVVARDAVPIEQLGFWANCLGVTGAPFDGEASRSRRSSDLSSILHSILRELRGTISLLLQTRRVADLTIEGLRLRSHGFFTQSTTCTERLL
jgi:cystathionine beta-lyase/cystathionine gamma-synthase